MTINMSTIPTAAAATTIMTDEICEVERIYYLDWLRIIIVLLLIPFHSGLTFVSWGSVYIKDVQVFPKSIEFFLGFLTFWFMPALFVISGMSSFFALQQGNPGRYIKERRKKLLIPFLTGLLTVCVLLSYFRALFKGSFQGNIIQFYPHFFTDGVSPNGNLSWGHLWFILYLLVFSMILLPLFIKMNSEKIKNKIIRKSAVLEKGAALYILALPIIITETLLRPSFPGNLNLISDWANFSLYIILFFYGYLFAVNKRILENIERILLFSVILGVILFALPFILKNNVITTRFNNPAYNAIIKFTWIVAVFGYAKKYLNFKNRIYAYMNKASFSIFIFHYIPVTVFSYYLVKSDMSPTLKYFICVIFSYPVTILIYEIVKRLPYLNVLFAIKENMPGKLQRI